MLAAYERLLSRSPVAVKSCIGVSLALAADATAQYTSHLRVPRESRPAFAHDTKRALAFSSLGGIWNGPVMHFYFNFLQRRFPQGGVRTLLTKTALNQLCMNPLVGSPLSLLCFSLCRPVQADGGWRAVCCGAPTSEREKGRERGGELPGCEAQRLTAPPRTPAQCTVRM